jgi:tripartite-type tricarboxylate transporter receptor subunit TctC
MTPRLAFLLTVLATLVAAAPASAQSWPAKPARIVVPFAAGGNTDSIARITADWLTQHLGGPFIV